MRYSWYMNTKFVWNIYNTDIATVVCMLRAPKSSVAQQLVADSSNHPIYARRFSTRPQSWSITFSSNGDEITSLFSRDMEMQTNIAISTIFNDTYESARLAMYAKIFWSNFHALAMCISAASIANLEALHRVNKLRSQLYTILFEE